ncbi:hypothetical protein [Microseira wollei]|uniref:Uncharacterized protein n=1 Tax=Microseira wollei NIES-4236 TaxID=2530354 RepID=A0AAV3X784_9CYAN|nr:hypothetical protein [Microseira wollei]GET38014.1 hypothetical protein MiSe_27680 [Microseira wollei NIES-4236]
MNILILLANYFFMSETPIIALSDLPKVAREHESRRDLSGG